MAAIQHKNIPEAQLHESKGVSTALADTVYVANGAGSGNWRPIAQYGSMVVTNNTNNFALTAVADTTFNTTSQYTLLTGANIPWASENLYGIGFTTDRLTVSITGMYSVALWMNIASFPSSTAKVAIRYRVNGSAFSSRKPTVKSAVVNDVSPIVGHGLIQLTAGDYVQLYVASDATGNLVVGDANMLLRLERQTA